jgi:hypothetical protein
MPSWNVEPWGLFTKNSILCTVVTLHGNSVKMCEHFPLNFGDIRTGHCIMTPYHITLSFLPGNCFAKKDMNHLPLALFFSVSPVEDTIEVTEAE